MSDRALAIALGEEEPDEPWPTPSPLSPDAGLDPFPADALPDWMGRWVTDTATATQVPTDMTAGLCLAVVAAATSGRLMVVPRRESSWSEPTCLFVVVAMTPGSRKSEVVKAATAPLAVFERDQIQAAGPTIREAESRQRIAASVAKDAETKASKAKSVGEREKLTQEALKAQDEAASIEVPAMPRLFSSDATPEALGALLGEQDGRFAVISPEGELFPLLLGRYNKGGKPNFETALKGHAGEMLRVDRKSGEPVCVDSTVLTLGLTVQPDVVRSLAGETEARGRGLLARMMWVIPDDVIGYRDSDVKVSAEAAQAAWVANVGRIAGRFWPLETPETLHFNAEAEEAVTGLLAEVEPRLRRHVGDLAHIRDWAAKWVGLCVRLAGILHAADGTGSTVSAETFANATRIGRWALGHALRAFDALGADPAIEDARHLLGVIERRQLSEWSVKELFDIVPRGQFAKVDDLRTGVEILEAHGWVRAMPAPEAKKRGRPRSPRYESHPQVLLPHNPQNLHIHRPGGDSAGSADSAARSGGDASA